MTSKSPPLGVRWAYAINYSLAAAAATAFAWPRIAPPSFEIFPTDRRLIAFAIGVLVFVIAWRQYVMPRPVPRAIVAVGARLGAPWVLIFFWATLLAGTAVQRPTASAPSPLPPVRLYVDAHNHGMGAVLPYWAYADLLAFLGDPEHPARVDTAHRRKLWDALVTSQANGTAPLNPRFSGGATATIQVYAKAGTDAEIDGALERVLTTTPWTEFDSAYAFRGGPVAEYLKTYLAKNATPPADILCEAVLLELAVTHTGYSEQFVSASGGLGSSAFDQVRCFMSASKRRSASHALQHWPAIEAKVLLMTSTKELGATKPAQGFGWSQYGLNRTECKEKIESPAPTLISPGNLKQALLGKDPQITSAERPDFLNTVIGIDTAGPEITCFTDHGMDHYKALVKAVYDAAVARRRENPTWLGKLVVHTHVGEGGPTYPSPGTSSTDFITFFETFPPVGLTPAGQPFHAVQARENLRMLLRAVDEIRKDTKTYKDVDQYLIFRFGHVTHALQQDADEMARLRIEADINLESNISTRAYYPADLVTASLRASVPAPPVSAPLPFEFNDLPAKVRATGREADILKDHALKYMLRAGVRTMLGSDGGGEEHADIGRQYLLAGELITYWQRNDSSFPKWLTPDVFEQNAVDHCRDRAGDANARCLPSQ